jgi:hypothetical protein
MNFGGNGATIDNRSGFSHNDNAQSYTPLVVQQFLVEKSIPDFTQPPQSPDLAPSDVWLLPTLELGLKGHVSQPWRV